MAKRGLTPEQQEEFKKLRGYYYGDYKPPKVDPSVAYQDSLAVSKERIAQGVPAPVDSARVFMGRKPEEPPKDSEILREYIAKRKLQIAGGATSTKTDITLGIVKKEEKESILAAGGRYAKKTAEKTKLLEAKIPREPLDLETLRQMTPGQVEIILDSWSAGGEKIFEKGSPEEKNIRKELEVYGDSSAMMKRALEKFSPDSDVKELISSYPHARKALKEYQELRKQGLNEDLAGEQIQDKYGYDLETLRGIYYVETGK